MYTTDSDIDFTNGIAAEDAAGYQQHNAEMNLAWQYVAHTGVSVFLTGKAGTGKTTFLRKLRQLSPKRMVVLAPTGVAAINAGGQTIHSFFQLPFGPFNPAAPEREGQSHYRMPQQKKDLIRSLDLVVIDEVSMVRADMLDQIDYTLRKYRDRSRPFGGVQLLLIGDLMQLSPVAKADEWQLLKEQYDSPYFFTSHALQSTPYVTVELTHIYRQQDREFIDLLAAVRNNRLTPADVRKLDQRYLPGFRPNEPGWIRLTTHNNTADTYNNEQLLALPTASHTFEARVTGDFPEYSYPTDHSLTLKEGAQVMFVKNDPGGAYHNGKIGTVTCCDGKVLQVTCPGDTGPIDVDAVSWENNKYAIDPETKEIKEEVAGTFSQIPLRLAWAITVHKSQGLTFDQAVLDINASFTHGQAYVALSRCRSLQGLVLASPLSIRSVITDSNVNSYIDMQTSRAQQCREQLPRLKTDYVVQLLDELYSMTTLSMDLQWLTRVVDEHLSRQQPSLLKALKEAQPAVTQLMEVAARFRDQYTTLAYASDGRIAGTQLELRIRESATYFLAQLQAIFAPILGLVSINIDNKSTAETYNNALSTLRNTLRLKTALMSTLTEEAFSPTLYLSTKAKAELDTPSAPSGRRQSRASKQPKEKKAPRVKGETVLTTHQLLRQGLTPQMIANRRGLTPDTIYKHLTTLVEQGKVNPDDVVAPRHRQIIREAIDKFDSSYSIAEVKETLPPDFTSGEIAFVIRLTR